MREFFRTSFRYNAWANGILLKALEAARTPPEKAVAAYQHVLEGERTWFARIMGERSPNAPFWTAPDLQRCHDWTMELLARTEYFFAHLEPSGLERGFSYTNSKGDRFTDRVDTVLAHVLLHSTQYRGESAGFAIAGGVAVPDLDMIFWLRDGSPEAGRDPKSPRPVFRRQPLSH
jgi:uncharacterized damage-inducible protein DinB